MAVEIADPPSGITTLIETVSPELGENPAGRFVPVVTGHVSVPPGAIEDDIVQVVLLVVVVEMSVK